MPGPTLKVAPFKRGGARAGAGRKPSELTERFRDHFAGDLDALMVALADLALGQYREDERGRVYTTAPDRGALVYILDRLLGKPKTEGDGPPADLGELLRALRGTDGCGA